jgi:hypothetical protein
MHCKIHEPTNDINHIHMVLTSDGGLFDVGSELCERKTDIDIGFKKTK